MPTAQEVLDFAANFSRTGQDLGVRMCQRFVRMAFGSPGGARTALEAWQQAQYKHQKGTPPAGAAVYWGGGGAGHSAISAGNGWIYSTDVTRPGKVDLVRMDHITKQWGKPLLGWSEDNNGIKITKFNAQPVKGGKASDYDPVYNDEGTAGGGASTVYSKKELRERYGYAAALYDQVPELRKLLALAYDKQWTEEEFGARVMATNWYRKSTEAEKAFALLSTSNPAEAQKQVRDRRQEIVNLYRRLGVPLTEDRLKAIARTSIIQNWSQQQITNAVADEFHYKPSTTFGGVAGETIDQFRQMSAAYVTPVSNKTLEQWTENVLRGEATPDDFTSYLKAQAKSLFPEMSDAIDRGVTVEQYLDPYRETVARTLEVNPEKVDWQDPKWSQAIFQHDDKGERRVMGLADFQRKLRTDTSFGYDKTQGAVSQAIDFSGKLAAMFGKTG